MGYEFAALYTEDEVIGRGILPFFNCGLPRKMIERVVQFNGIEELSVIGKPLIRRKSLRIKDPFPVPIAETRCPHKRPAFCIFHDVYILLISCKYNSIIHRFIVNNELSTI